MVKAEDLVEAGQDRVQQPVEIGRLMDAHRHLLERAHRESRVGSFELAREIPDGEMRAGEPVTVTYRVTGSGNFDQVAVGGIEPSTDWKVYPGKTTSDVDGVTGTKTFTQTIVPAHAGALTVPAVSLAYFDPKAKAYRPVRPDGAQP